MSVTRIESKSGKGAPILIEYKECRCVFLNGFFITGTGLCNGREVFEEMYTIALNLSKTTGKLVMHYKVYGTSPLVASWEDLYKILSRKEESKYLLTSSMELI